MSTGVVALGGRLRDQAADVDAAAECLGAAFSGEGFSRWVAGPGGDLRAEMTGMFRSVLPVHLAGGDTVEATAGFGAVAVWVPPGAGSVEAGPREARPEVEAAFREINAHHPAAPHWYLAFLGAREARKGEGSLLLSHGIARADAQGIPTALWTGTEVNLHFYGKHGYEVVHHLRFDGAQAWWLWRPAPSS